MGQLEITYVGVTPDRADRSPIDAAGQPVPFDLNGLSRAQGTRITFTNNQPVEVRGVASLRCMRIFPDEPTPIGAQATIPANGTGSVAAFCPAGQVPVGQVSTVDGVNLSTRFVVFLSGSPPTVTIQDDLLDGTHPPPLGIGRSVANHTSSPPGRPHRDDVRAAPRRADAHCFDPYIARRALLRFRHRARRVRLRRKLRGGRLCTGASR